MFSIYSLKVLMRERLTAVAEEILAEFEKITDGYEEEIHRQRELLEAFTVIQTCKPQIKLHRIDFPEQHYFNVKEVLANQQHCNQERSSSLYHEEPEALQTEEDLEKLCTTQQAEQLPLKQEADTIMIPIYEESDHSESESMDEEFLSPDSPIAESQDQFGIKHIDSELRTKTKHNDLQSHCNNADDSPISSSQCKSDLNFPQQLDLKEDEAFADEQLWNQVGCSSLEEPEPPCIKEETEELCNSQQGEQLVLKQEADDIMETQFDEESDHSESGSLSYDLLFPCPLTEILDELGSQHAYCGSVKKSELKKKTEHNSLQSICNNADDSPISSSPCKSDLNFAQQLDLKENETLTDEQLLNQAGCSSRDQEDLEEFCNSRQAEEPKQEADAVMVTPIYEEDFAQQLDLKENETLTDEQLSNQAGCSSRDQEDLEEFCNSRQAEEPKQEADAVMVTPIYEEGDHSKPDSINEQVLPLTPPLAQSPVQMGSNHVESATLRNSELNTDPKHVAACFQNPSNDVVHTPKSKSVQGPEKCDICGIMLKNKAQLYNHKKTHISDRPHTCPICHKGFIFKCQVNYHMRTHKGVTLFPCTLCGKGFTSLNILADHMNRHKHQKPSSCTICGETFTSENALGGHMNRHKDQEPISCTRCGKSFTSEITLARHMKRHTDKEQFPCKICGNSFPSRSALSDHMKEHRDKGRVSCTICGKSFTSEITLASHMKRHTGETWISCTICGNRFTSQRALTCHMKRHTDNGTPYVCEQCGKGFTKKFILLQHMKAHKEEEPFSCEVCGKSFKSKSSLIEHGKPYKDRKKRTSCPTCGKSFRSSCRLCVHIKTHKRFSCNVCGKRFSLKIPLYLHMEKKCKAPMQYSCEICGKSFHLESSLVGHVKTHDPKEKVLCKICGKSFNSAYYLSVHSKSHGPKPYSCDTCGKSFHLESSLVGHVKTHDPEKKVLCKICGKGFKSSFSLSIHSERHVPRPYSCDKCGKSFQCEVALFRHVKKYHVEKNNLCEICGKAFEHPSGLSLHMITHAQYMPHSCDKCGKCFNAKKLYNLHLRQCCAAE